MKHLFRAGALALAIFAAAPLGGCAVTSAVTNKLDCMFSATGCATKEGVRTPEQNLTQQVFDSRAHYDAYILTPAATYWHQPACPQPAGVACANPDIAAQLRKGDAAVKLAFDDAEATARRSPQGDIKAILADANDAIVALTTIMAMYNIH